MRRETAILELEKRGQKRVRFGNEMEKLEKTVIRNCRLLRVRADRKALRRKVRYLERDRAFLWRTGIPVKL